jgi:hypothetical protein
MLDGFIGRGLIRQWFLIQVVFKDRLHTAITGAANGDSSATSGLKSIIAIAFGQP